MTFNLPKTYYTVWFLIAMMTGLTVPILVALIQAILFFSKIIFYPGQQIKKQHTMSRSSAESEYSALAAAI